MDVELAHGLAQGLHRLFTRVALSQKNRSLLLGACASQISAAARLRARLLHKRLRWHPGEPWRQSACSDGPRGRRISR